MKVHEHHHRTLYKSISWFIVGFFVAFGVLILLFTDDIKTAAFDALIIQIIKFVFFYIHERIWNKFAVGQEVMNEDTHPTT